MQTAFSDYTDPTKVALELNEETQTTVLSEGFNDAVDHMHRSTWPDVCVLQEALIRMSLLCVLQVFVAVSVVTLCITPQVRTRLRTGNQTVKTAVCLHCSHVTAKPHRFCNFEQK